MIKKIYTLFIGVSSLAWSMDTLDKENTYPNLSHEARSPLKEKAESLIQKKQVSECDTRTPEEIEKRIDFLEGELAEYQFFNQQHHEIIRQLKGLNFFEKSFPSGNSEVLKILESVFTNNYGKGGSWGYIVSELNRRPQRFIKEFDQLVEDVTNKESEKNPEIRKLLDEIYSEIGPVSLMIIYYLKNKA